MRGMSRSNRRPAVSGLEIWNKKTASVGMAALTWLFHRRAAAKWDLTVAGLAANIGLISSERRLCDRSFIPRAHDWYTIEFDSAPICPGFAEKLRIRRLRSTIDEYLASLPLVQCSGVLVMDDWHRLVNIFQSFVAVQVRSLLQSQQLSRPGRIMKWKVWLKT